jgi:hypothetical protein
VIGIVGGGGAVERGMWKDGRGPGERAGDKDSVQVVLGDQAVEVSVGEALARIGAPVTEEPWLRVPRLQGLPKQRVILEVEHPEAEVEAGAPVRVDFAQLVGAERRALDRRAGRTVRGNRVGQNCSIEFDSFGGSDRFRLDSGIQFSGSRRNRFLFRQLIFLLVATLPRRRF